MSFQQVPVDLPVPEIMVADALHPAWTGDWSSNCHFQLQVDTDHCKITAIVRIHLIGVAAGAAQRQAWKTAIEAKWNNQFKLCCADDCPNGYTIACELQFVDNPGDAHYTVTVNRVAAGVRNDETHWTLGDQDDPTHEFGHYLGNTDEYYTVNGHDYGEPNQAPSNVMNNSKMPPEPKHMALIKKIAEALLGRGAHCIARRVSEKCQ